jgi:hypothetical protein
MKQIPKKQQNEFCKKMQNELQKIGAVPFVSDALQFDLKTKKHGILWLRIDNDSSCLFSVFGRFLNTDNLPDLPSVNSYSGKFNHHLSGSPENVVNEIVNSIKSILN